MRKGNVDGPPSLGVLRDPVPLSVAAFSGRLDGGAMVLDCRSPEAFGGGHVPGARNVGLGHAFPTWAGTVLPPERELLLVLDGPDQVWPVAWHLLRIGLAVPYGFLADGMSAWRTSGRPVAFLPQWTVYDLERARSKRDDLCILDVRQPGEWQAGRVPGAIHVSGAELPGRLDELPRGNIAVYCGSGYRSSVAASLLRSHGFEEISNVAGGFSAWSAAQLPVER